VPGSLVSIEVVIRQQLKRPMDETLPRLIPAGWLNAQTHRATLVDGREVAVKVQRPGIDTVPRISP